MSIASTLNERIVHTLDACGLFVLSKTPSEIEYILLEDVNADIYSYLSKENLDLLLEEKFLDRELVNKLSDIRKGYASLEETSWGDAETIKQDPLWHNWLTMCDTTRALKEKYDVAYPQTGRTQL